MFYNSRNNCMNIRDSAFRSPFPGLRGFLKLFRCYFVAQNWLKWKENRSREEGKENLWDQDSAFRSPFPGLVISMLFCGSKLIEMKRESKQRRGESKPLGPGEPKALSSTRKLSVIPVYTAVLAEGHNHKAMDESIISYMTTRNELHNRHWMSFCSL